MSKYLPAICFLAVLLTSALPARGQSPPKPAATPTTPRKRRWLSCIPRKSLLRTMGLAPANPTPGYACSRTPACSASACWFSPIKAPADSGHRLRARPQTGWYGRGNSGGQHPGHDHRELPRGPDVQRPTGKTCGRKGSGDRRRTRIPGALKRQQTTGARPVLVRLQLFA